MMPVRAYIEANRERFLRELSELCAIPSVMGRGAELERAAALVAGRLRAVGAEVTLLATPSGPPVVFGEVGTGAKSVLSYSHYDVQPEDPLDAWETPPFRPFIRDDKLFARGVSDDKGDVMARIQAVETYQALYGPLPLRLKLVIEGEEEQGSHGMPAVAQEHSHLFEADGVLWEGGNKDSAGRYTMYAGMKGGVFFELVVEGANSDLHSAYAPLTENPAWRLVQALASLRAPDGRLTMDGLMDHWRPPTEAELAYVAQIPFDGDALKESWGVTGFLGHVSERQALVNFIYQPTCNICGLTSGYQGAGVKSIVPRRASAKLDLRLVPDLTPELVYDLLRRHLERRGFADFTINPDLSLRASRSSLEDPFLRAAIATAGRVYGHAPVVYPNHGGSGPMATLCDDLGMPGIAIGVGYYGMNMHAPNENIRIQDYLQGIEYLVAFFRAWAGE